MDDAINTFIRLQKTIKDLEDKKQGEIATIKNETKKKKEEN